MASIAGHDILSQARRANFNVPIYDYEILPLGEGSVARSGLFVAAADLISVVAAVTPTASGVALEHTIAAQPDVPRRLQVRLVDGSNNNTFTKVLISGYDRHQEVVSELVHFVGPGSQTLTTVHAYHTVSAVKSYFSNSTTTGVTVGVGLANGLALPCDIRHTDDIIGLWTEDMGTPGTLLAETVSSTTVDTRYGVWTPTVVPDGAAIKYWVSLRSTLGLTSY